MPETTQEEQVPVMPEAREFATDSTTPSVASPERELTTGERLVGLTFNPSGDPDVYTVKRLFAEVIDTVQRAEVGWEMGGQFVRLSIDLAIQAQMMAVKALTWKE